MVDDTVEESGELIGITERALVDAVEDCGELGVELVMRVQMCVSEVLNVLGEVAEEEDILLTDLAGDLDLPQC